MGAQILLGLSGALYVSTNGRTTWGTLNASTGIYTGAPANSLSLIQVVRNVTLNNEAMEADFSNRYSNWKLTGPALYNASIEMDIPWTPSDSGLQALIGSYFGRYSLPMAVLDATLTNFTVAAPQGLWSDFQVMSLPLEQPLEKEQMVKMKLVPTAGPSVLAGIPPAWVQV